MKSNGYWKKTYHPLAGLLELFENDLVEVDAGSDAPNPVSIFIASPLATPLQYCDVIASFALLL